MFLDGEFLRSRVERTREGGKIPGRGNGDCKGSEAGLGSAWVRTARTPERRDPPD